MTVTMELDAQYRQLREECGLLDRSERGKLIVSGGEGAEYLQGQLTNDVEALAPAPAGGPQTRAPLSLTAPRGAAAAGTAALPEHVCEARTVAGVACVAV